MPQSPKKPADASPAPKSPAGHPIEAAKRATGHEAVTLRNAAVVIAVILAGAAVKWLSPILSPLALAIFLLMMIDGFADWLRRRLPSLPNWAAIALSLAAFVGVFAITVVVIAEYAVGIREQVTSYAPRLNNLLERVAGMVGLEAPPSINQLFTRLNPAQYISGVLGGLQTFTSNAVFVLIYLGFLLASQVGFKKKVVRLFPGGAERTEAAAVFGRIREGVQRYLWIQTVTGALIAILSWGVMMAVGLDNAGFWAFIIFIAGYIPIIGGAIGCFVPPIFALVQFDVLWPAIVLLVVLNVINFIVANVLLPRMQGESLNLDPVVVLLALAFWGAIWGLAGMFLSTPLTVMAMVILAQFRGTLWIAILLSGDGDPLGEGRKSAAKAKA
jgi:AI-2 transport protein TqsA